MTQKNPSAGLGAISSSLYVSFQVIANVLSVKIALLPLLHWPIDGGTIIYPLTFTLRDFVHKTLGKKIARQIVITAGVINALMALLFLLVGRITPDPAWPYQEAYQQILLPVWRITAASIISQVLSELLDTEVFSAIYKKFNDTLAVFLSNLAGLLADSLAFGMLAFYGSLPLRTVMQIVITNILVKLIMSIITTPSIKLVPRTVNFEEI